MLSVQPPAMIHQHQRHTPRRGLFRGLKSLSPHIITATESQQGLPPPYSQSASVPVSPASMSMGRPSYDGAVSLGGKPRRSWFGSSKSEMAAPAAQAAPAPRCESFLLEVQCTTCRARRRQAAACPAAGEYNVGGGRFAFLVRGPNGQPMVSSSSSSAGKRKAEKAKFKYSGVHMEERVLALDLCDFAHYATVARAKEVLRRHMGDPYMAAEQGSALPPVNVGVLLDALRRERVDVEEPVKKVDDDEGWW